MALVLTLFSLVVVDSGPADAAAPVVHCETNRNSADRITVASGVYAGNLGTPGNIPSGYLAGDGYFGCPPERIDRGWFDNHTLERFVIERTGTTVKWGINHYIYTVVHQMRHPDYSVAGSEVWTVYVPYYYSPRLATNSGLLTDSLYVTTNGVRYKLADLKMNLAFVEDPIGKLQKGYFSELSVNMAPGVPTLWTYTTSKKQGEACSSYPETVGDREYWYLRCDVDITFFDPTKLTGAAELTVGGEAGRENAKAAGEVKLSGSAETQGTYIYYKFQTRIALGLFDASAGWVRRAGNCMYTSMGYLITVLSAYEPWVNVREAWPVHGGRCRFDNTVL
ncbi:hypothetical protein ACFY3U_24615 [Micromonospora sp. NPDC000089]|uniref:hypothetical protein n=1 Tax=unclassified Micromonospora TaxID=2617518 RepID=UPI0036922DAF